MKQKLIEFLNDSSLKVLAVWSIIISVVFILFTVFAIFIIYKLGNGVENAGNTSLISSYRDEMIVLGFVFIIILFINELYFIRKILEGIIKDNKKQRIEEFLENVRNDDIVDFLSKLIKLFEQHHNRSDKNENT